MGCEGLDSSNNLCEAFGILESPNDVTYLLSQMHQICSWLLMLTSSRTLHHVQGLGLYHQNVLCPASWKSKRLSGIDAMEQ